MKQFYISRLMMVAAMVAGSCGVMAQTSTFSYVAAVQTYTVPAGVTSISITASGAQGGGNISPIYTGGLGATLTGTFTVTPGHVLDIIVGQEPGVAAENAGGGGGSFVWDASSATLPLIAAGGGGGASSTEDGINASLTTSGTDGGGGAAYGGAGTMGSGGTAPSSSGSIGAAYGAGGCGWLSNGANGYPGTVIIAGEPIASGGITPLGGGAGGGYGGVAGSGGNGGYGGGGGGEAPGSASTSSGGGGGGGGGYSGGGGGAGTPAHGGGGGGSYCAGTLGATSVTNTGNGLVTITVLCAPGPITGAASLCVGSSETVSCTPTGGTWMSTNPAIATITGFGVVSGVAAGTDTILYIVVSGCGTTDTAMTPLIVTGPTSAGTISGTLTVCVGATTPLSETLTGGTWSASNANATVGSTGIVTGVTAGTDIITYTNSCGSGYTTAVVTINPLPSAGTVTTTTAGGAYTVCVGGTITLMDGTAGGTWSASNTDATVAGGVVVGVTAGTDSIKYSVTNSCGTAVASKVVTINALPSAGTITGSVNVCVGSTIVLTTTGTGGTWSATNGHATVSGGSVAGVSAGVDTIKYTVTNSCGTATATFSITVNAVATAGTISGPSSVCAGATITLTDATGGGSWSATNANATVAGGVVTGATAGIDTIDYAVTNGCGTVTATATVTVNPSPSAGTITGTDSLCIGKHDTLTDATAGGLWGASNGKASVSVTGVVTGVAAGMDTITYKVTAAGCTGTASLVVKVNSCGVGIENVSLSAMLNVYPNPAMDELNIENAGIGSVIKLFSISGTQVYSGVISSDKQTINIRSLPPGAYILQLTDVNGDRNTKMVMKQ